MLRGKRGVDWKSNRASTWKHVSFHEMWSCSWIGTSRLEPRLARAKYRAEPSTPQDRPSRPGAASQLFSRVATTRRGHRSTTTGTRCGQDTLHWLQRGLAGCALRCEVRGL